MIPYIHFFGKNRSHIWRSMLQQYYFKWRSMLQQYYFKWRSMLQQYYFKVSTMMRINLSKLVYSRINIFGIGQYYFCWDLHNFNCFLYTYLDFTINSPHLVLSKLLFRTSEYLLYILPANGCCALHSLVGILFFLLF